MVCFFFFKQKTAYEMRISDWSSDVCSSDLKDGSILPATTLGRDDAEDMSRIGELISRYERRAMEAERETVDRYVAAYLAEKTGEIIDARITGVQNFGFFATVEGLGGDGLVPVSTLGAERFIFDEAGHALEGEQSGDRYELGQRLKLRLAEANPVSGALRFELLEGVNHMPIRDRPQGRPRPINRRGRPAHIRPMSNPKGKRR